MDPLTPTHLDYLLDMYCYQSQATLLVAEVAPAPGLILDRTILYPQGGGQLSDTGSIGSAAFSFAVRKVVYRDGVVHHEGQLLHGTPSPGEVVAVEVDEGRRRHNSALQSGGHLLLNAMRDAGHGLVATKGYHFPDGPYVEFSGTLSDAERESLVERLQKEVDRLIGANLPISARLVDHAELHQFCENVPANIPTDKPIRIVTIDGFSQPCGGTHVSSTGQLVGLKVEKVKGRKGDLRVSYSLPASAAS